MQENSLVFDALILAGGRSSRLGGVPKQSLVFQGQTLLERALDAAAGARRTVVVGDSAFLPSQSTTPRPVSPAAWPADVLTCREEPPFAGPAAAIAAGLNTLGENGGAAPFTLVLACDMPLASEAVAVLRKALAASAARPGGGGGGGVMALAGDGKVQPLAAFYSTPGLKQACAELAARDALVNGSVRALLASLDVQLVTVPAGSTSDVDTWDDAAALGVAARSQRECKDRSAGGTNVGGKS
ncbi:NTP transferase domain-containing protein [Arthrobacter sp. FW306-05-C]|uniref:molybdenum cofactor guanylyltransferase n=1 Tax=Arthrobacter TaxID=1663 RepID=UPI001EEFA55C|nr:MULTISPECIES: NTP transferase domain-containing protein [Arthrobacter]MDP9987676.1 molybdopterin-guanine dinucleotide biosynthesis protein A [Arthrobacter oryzae]UKA67556.1 NTP transferase domain-containing protein [Arthrobacter sp. FW306-05-C]UKA72033.1 NTP transferase domain-containing protein [Arthrobacter sp. FW306-06-A]